MENKSNNVLVGGVVLVLLLVTLVVIVWLAGFSGGREQKFDIFFKSGVSGLNKGSAVTFSGVPVGTVDDIALMPDQPEFVRVRIAVKEGVPVLQGTTATISGVGFTGVSQIDLDGAVKGAPPIACPEENAQAACPEGVPVIPTKPGALAGLLNSAPELLDKVSTLTDRLGELLNDRNRNSIGNILRNVDKLTGSLADRGPEIAATLAETRETVHQAAVAAQQIGLLAANANGMITSDVKPAMAKLNQAIGAAQHSMETLDSAITDARPGLKTFSNQTLPNVNQLVRDLSDMAQNLSAVAEKLDRGGAGGLLKGSTLPDYNPGKK